MNNQLWACSGACGTWHASWVDLITSITEGVAGGERETERGGVNSGGGAGGRRGGGGLSGG